MWSLNNQTPYAAERGWIRDNNGAEVWIVAVKATYDILPDGATVLSKQQERINSGVVLYPDSEEVRYETDLGPEKDSTDVVLNGHAWAPEGNPVSSLVVGLKVGDVTRLARVQGDRIWDGNGYCAPVPFDKLPLRANRMSVSSGEAGEDANPLGIPIMKSPRKDISRLPNIEFIGSNAGADIGFGPVPRHWPARLRYAGTYDQRWENMRSPLLPEDFDPHFWQTAPASQYAGGLLRGGEIVTLANMTSPEFSYARVLSFAIPKISLGLITRFFDGSSQSHRARMHTLIIEPDYPRISVVWHSALPCHHLVNQLESTLITEKKRLMLRLAPLPTAFREWESL
ncbi:DUF2169 domain-containing protein [Enterobacter sp.]|uniref:DUF2169 family type VI secretion system accessory protein n=1 Tax=Enterobacter sp. TaxID=42895 RepID=UPI0031D36F67